MKHVVTGIKLFEQDEGSEIDRVIDVSKEKIR